MKERELNLFGSLRDGQMALWVYINYAHDAKSFPQTRASAFMYRALVGML